MKFRIQVVRGADDGAEQMKEVMEFERQELAMETLGMSLAEGKAVLKGVLQEFVAEQQAAEFLQRERTCRHCARHLSSKGAGSTSVRTVFGTVRLPNPRWNQCDCQSTGKGTFRPLQGWLCGGKPVLSCRRESHGLKQANASSHRIATWSLVAAAVALAASIYAILTHVLH
jgi:hypothetical protein